MFPWVYEFQWSVFHVTFLIFFLAVFTAIIGTVLIAMHRTYRTAAENTTEPILWHSTFDDLPPVAKKCRHELSGTLRSRSCDNEFRCSDCRVHAAIRARKRPAAPLQFEAFGFTMPPYRKYHRGHTWVQEEKDGTMTVGIDDFGRRIVGKHFSVELPPVGTHLSVNGNGLLVRRVNSTLRLLSPISGEVVEHGREENDWYLRIRPEGGNGATDHLLSGDEVPAWINKELERLQASCRIGGVGVALADGGELTNDFHRYYPDADWDGILGSMFLDA